MRNHLFIGLGGQGVRTIAELRKVMAQRARDTEALTKAAIRLDFLAIDSSTDARNDLKCWNYFGTDLSLGDNDWVPLNSLSPQDVDGLALRADVSAWIGNRDQIKSFLKGNKIEGANQRRRFGRLLFAHNATTIRQAIFGQKVNALTAAGFNQCAFHIFASMAGGTGSGCLVDLIASIRAQYPNSELGGGYPIFVYVYATHNEGKASDVGYFYQNQFTTLRDLNALMCDRLEPHLLGTNVAGQVYDGHDACAQVVLTTSLNRMNIRVSLPTQIRMVAESCFERIYAWTAGHLEAAAQQSITGQDVLATFAGEPLRQPERSYRFAGFGMRRWEVPNAKIEELLALDLMASGLRQMLYNHWQPNTGYADSLPNLPKAVSAAASEKLAAVAGEYLLLPDRSVEYNRTLREEIGQLVGGMLQESGGQADLEALELGTKSYYENTFQEGGVDSLVQRLKLEQGGQLDESVDRMDHTLSALWMNHAYPLALAHLPEMIAMLISALQGKLESQTQYSNEEDRLARRRALRRVEWEKITQLSALVGKRRTLYRAHAADCAAGHGLKLQGQCSSVDASFLTSLLGRLQMLKAGYESARDSYKALLDATVEERDGIYNDLRKLQGETGANKYEFKQADLDDFLKVMRGHQTHQVAAAGMLRATVGEYLGGGPLTALRHTGSSERMEEMLRKTAMEKARAIHEDLALKKAAPKILGDSLLKRLEERFGSDHAALRTEVAEFVKLAASCLHCRDGQTQPMTLLGQNKGVPMMPKRVLILGLPGQGHPYTDLLTKTFAACHHAGDEFVYATYTHSDPTQLRLFFVDYWLAARFTTTAAELGIAYETAAKGRQTSDIAYFCNIDPEGESGKRPDLFLPGPDEMRVRYEAELWLGRHLKASNLDNEPSPLVMDDEHGVFLIINGDQPDRTSEKLGGPGKALEMANEQKMFLLHATVCDALTKIPGDRNHFVERLIKQKNDELSGKETSPEFQHWTRLRAQLQQFTR